MDESRDLTEELNTGEAEGAGEAAAEGAGEGAMVQDAHSDAVAFENAESGASSDPAVREQEEAGEAVPVVLDVAGFHFLSRADAEKAQVDINKIAYIDTHAAYSSREAMRAIYEKAIENRIFGTPVGWLFLKQLRDNLIKGGVQETELSSIPMSVSFTHEPMVATAKLAEARGETERRVAEARQRTGAFLIVSVVLNILLAAMVILMFYIASVSESDNILNYKRNVTNRYATWEQQLNERERAVRQRERELGIRSGESTEGDTQGE